MLYGFSGYGGGFGQTSKMRRATITPWGPACNRLRIKLNADASADPQGLCRDLLMASSCASAYVTADQSTWRKQVRAEIGQLYRSAGEGVASMLVYCLSNMAGQQSGTTASQAMLYLRSDYMRVTGRPVLSPTIVGKLTSTAAPVLQPGSLWGGAPTADSPRLVRPGDAIETTAMPGRLMRIPGPSAEDERGITPTVDAATEDVLVCPPGTYWDDVAGGCVVAAPDHSVPPPPTPRPGEPPIGERKPVWPWVVGGAAVVGLGVVIFAAKRKKRR